MHSPLPKPFARYEVSYLFLAPFLAAAFFAPFFFVVDFDLTTIVVTLLSCALHQFPCFEPYLVCVWGPAYKILRFYIPFPDSCQQVLIGDMLNNNPLISCRRGAVHQRRASRFRLGSAKHLVVVQYDVLSFVPTPEESRKLCRQMARPVLTLIVHLGFEIRKHNHSELTNRAFRPFNATVQHIRMEAIPVATMVDDAGSWAA